MENFFLNIICGSVLLLVTAFGLASPKHDPSLAEAQTAPLLNIVPR
jgi:hypothetical protein